MLKDTLTMEEQDSVDGEALKASALLSSSINLPEAFYRRLKQTAKPVFAWVVDSPLQLRTALSRNVDGIISNDPFFLKLVLKSWWKRCRET